MTKRLPAGLLPVVSLALAIPASSSAQGQEKRFSAQALEAESQESAAPRLKARRVIGGEVMTSVLVKLYDSLSSYQGGIAGLAATSPRATGASRLSVRSPAARAYLQHTERQKRAFEGALRGAIPSARLVHDLRVVFGGVSVIVPESRVADLRRLPGVQAVYPDEALPLDTDRSPAIIKAPKLWDALGGQDEAGEGVIVGVIDTGIWPEHPSFADPSPSGGAYPPPPASWTGTSCQFGSANPDDPPFTCNNKLIGAQRFMATFDMFGPPPLPGEFFSARDNNGHGSHTSSTAAGNGDVAATILGSPLATVTGIAPRAHVAAYKVCFTNSDGSGSCFVSDSAAAIQQGILDGVDVLNFSIGGGGNPYADASELAFLDAYAAGVFVAASAGNAGPGPDTVDHRGPWVTTVGASTTDRDFVGSADINADGGASLHVDGKSIMGPITTPAPVVLASDPPYNDVLCLNPAGAGTLTGKIVVCKRGTNARVNKGFNVLQGGAAGMILYNPSLNTLNADTHFLPAIHIDHIQGATLVAFLGANTGELGTFSGGQRTLTGQADVMAAFSSRGGSGQTLGVSKPDVTAPGVDILAGQSPALAATGASPPGELFQVISGTSMSSPHVAGAAALLKDLNPSWTPGQIKSVLMTTAHRADVFKEDGVTPAGAFDFGSGRIDLKKAKNPGVTFDATAGDYVLHAGDLFNTNYPSIYFPVMPGQMTVQRTAHSELLYNSVWHLQGVGTPDMHVIVPILIFVPAGGDVTFGITVDASAVPLGQVRFGDVILKGPDQRLHIPIALVRKQTGVTLLKTCSPTTLNRGETTACTIAASNTTFDDANVAITDHLPRQLRLQSVSGATMLGPRDLSFNGTLDGAEPPDISVANEPGSSPAGGYLSLGLFGVPPLPGVGDETITNFNVPAFQFGGENWTRIGMVSDGYMVAGGGTGADIQFINQNLPDPARPNNVIAPFWSDLNPGAAGTMKAAFLTDGVNTWMVFEWEQVPNFSAIGATNSFQAWIGINGVEDISMVYDGDLTAGELGFLTVGAENKFGNRGDNYYVDGVGTLPTSITELRVHSIPGVPGDTHTIDFTARAGQHGNWMNCASMTTDITFGVSVSCTSGTVN